MADAFSAGPGLCFVGIGGGYASKSPVFLGTGKGRPKIRRNRRWVPVMNDIAGDEPYDWSWMGQNGMVAYQLTRWNEPVYLAIAQMPNPFRGIGLAGAAAIEGLESLGDTGTLVMTEGMTFPLWITQPQTTIKPAYAALGHHPGWRFYDAFLLGPDELERGTAPAETHIVFYCMRGYNRTFNTFGLFDHNMAGLPGGGFLAPD